VPRYDSQDLGRAVEASSDRATTDEVWQSPGQITGMRPRLLQ